MKTVKYPTTRFEEFFDILKNHKNILFKIFIALTLFFSPLLLGILSFQFFQNSLKSELNENLITLESFYYYMSLINILYFILFLVLLGFFSLGLSGILQIFKNLVWQEPIFFLNDFKKGIKSMFLNTYIGIVVLFVLFYSLNLTIVFNSLINSDQLLTVIVFFQICFLILCLYLIFHFIFLNTLYKLSLRERLHNSFSLMFKKYYLISVSSIVVLLGILFFIPNVLIYFLYLLFVLLLAPLWLLIITLCTYSIYDASINKTHYPQIYRKGLYSNENNL